LGMKIQAHKLGENPQERVPPDQTVRREEIRGGRRKIAEKIDKGTQGQSMGRPRYDVSLGSIPKKKRVEGKTPP